MYLVNRRQFVAVVMDFPIQMNAIRMGFSIMYFKGSQVKNPNNDVLQYKIVFILANSVDPDEMAQNM